MSKAQDTRSVSIYFVNAAVARLNEERKLRVLGIAGIPPVTLEAPAARVPASAFSALWLAIAHETNDEFFGLDRRPLKVGSFALLCQAALSSPTVGGALRRVLRGFSVLLDDLSAQLNVGDGFAQVVLVNRLSSCPDRRFADETMLTLIHGIMCWLRGARISLEAVEFAYPRPSHAGEYSLMYSKNIKFDCAHTLIRFDRHVLSANVTRNEEALRTFLKSAPQSVFLKFFNEDSWSSKVRRRLQASSPKEWLSFRDLSTDMGLTSTTLRRRLNSEGATYRTIKDQLRNDIAIDFLCSGRAPIEELSARIGFGDVSAFHRAFKRWNGVQPSEYRRQQGAGGAPAESRRRTLAAVRN